MYPLLIVPLRGYDDILDFTSLIYTSYVTVSVSLQHAKIHSRTSHENQYNEPLLPGEKLAASHSTTSHPSLLDSQRGKRLVFLQLSREGCFKKRTSRHTPGTTVCTQA